MLAWLWSAWNQTSLILWLAANILMAGYAVLHLIARRWPTNVFHRMESWVFIAGGGLSGLTGLALSPWFAG
jgi:hypothetical protein